MRPFEALQEPGLQAHTKEAEILVIEGAVGCLGIAGHARSKLWPYSRTATKTTPKRPQVINSSVPRVQPLQPMLALELGKRDNFALTCNSDSRCLD